MKIVGLISDTHGYFGAELKDFLKDVDVVLHWGDWGSMGPHTMMEDEHTLTKLVKEMYPDLPYFMFGHSMGSFIARDYITKYGAELKTMHLPYGKLMELLTERRYAGRTGIKGTKYSSVDALQNCDIPVLFGEKS